MQTEVVRNVETTTREIERVAESLGSFDLTPKGLTLEKKAESSCSKQKTWSRQKKTKVKGNQSKTKGLKGLGKRQLVDVMVADGSIEDIRGDGKKRQVVKMDVDEQNEEVVLETQHRLQQ